jgi:hypothetical protein
MTDRSDPDFLMDIAIRTRALRVVWSGGIVRCRCPAVVRVQRHPEKKERIADPTKGTIITGE